MIAVTTKKHESLRNGNKVKWLRNVTGLTELGVEFIELAGRSKIGE